MSNRFLLCFVAVSIASVSAITKEEIANVKNDIVLPHIATCSEKFSVTREQIKEAREKKDPDALSPCFYDCVFKGMGVLDAQDKFRPEVIVEAAKKYIAIEEDQKNVEFITNLCIKVNDAAVNGECERAKLLFKCALENKVLLLLH